MAEADNIWDWNPTPDEIHANIDDPDFRDKLGMLTIECVKHTYLRVRNRYWDFRNITVERVASKLAFKLFRNGATMLLAYRGERGAKLRTYISSRIYYTYFEERSEEGTDERR